MSKARDLADFQGSASALTTGTLPVDRVPYVGRRNLIINGGFDVWQRGTSGFTTSGGYTADRWWLASDAASVERSSEAPAGFAYSMKINTSASNTSIGQAIELQTGSSSPMVAGETVTVSFYAKTATGIDYIGATINFRDSKYSGTNQSVFGDIGGQIATTEWQRFTGTFTVPAINPTNVLAGFEIYGIDADIYITGVQLELGSVATPFEHRSYGEELALCQRYYVRYENTSSGNNMALASGAFYSAYNAECVFYLPTAMRTSPAFYTSDIVTNHSNWRFLSNGAKSFTTSSTVGCTFDADPTGVKLGRINVFISDGTGTSGYGGTLQFRNATGTPPWIAFDAEL